MILSTALNATSAVTAWTTEAYNFQFMLNYYKEPTNSLWITESGDPYFDNPPLTRPVEASMAYDWVTIAKSGYVQHTFWYNYVLPNPTDHFNSDVVDAVPEVPGQNIDPSYCVLAYADSATKAANQDS